MISDAPGGLLVSVSPGEDEVVQAGDAEHGVVGAVAFQAPVAENLSALHAGEAPITDYNQHMISYPTLSQTGYA